MKFQGFITKLKHKLDMENPNQIEVTINIPSFIDGKSTKPHIGICEFTQDDE